MKKQSVILISLAMMPLVVSCSGSGTKPDKPDKPDTPDVPSKVAVQSISVTPTTLTLEPGKTAQLTAEVLPENADDKSVSWESQNGSVASVSQQGLVTANTEGSTRITVRTTDGGKTAFCDVTVKAKEPDPVKPSFTLANGETELVLSRNSGAFTLETVGDYYDWTVDVESDGWLRAEKESAYRPPRLWIDVDFYGDPSLIIINGDPDAKPREGVINIYDATGKDLLFSLPVYQDPFPYIGRGQFKVSPDGGETEVYVQANIRGWYVTLDLEDYEKEYYDNSWFEAIKGEGKSLLLKVKPWNVNDSKPHPGLITIEGYGSRNFYTVEYYDPSVSGEKPGYGEGGPWD